MKGITISKVGSTVVLTLILVFGFLKFWVLELSVDLILFFTDVFKLPIDNFLNYLQDQAVSEELRRQSIGWIIYYPVYFLLHVAFIHFLFINNSKARKWVWFSLLVFVFGTIGLWVFFKVAGFPKIGDFFRLQFRKLFSLPFILLIIEGGRILFKDIQNKV